MGGVNPFDEAGIVEGLGHSSAEINAAVFQALQAAGAERGHPSWPWVTAKVGSMQ